MSAPDVSVIIPCFNQGHYLAEALESIPLDSGISIEVIIVDDGSTDDFTKQKFAELSEKGFRILHKANGGVATARNMGIRASTAPFFIPLDSDNQLFSPYLLDGLKWMKENPNCAVVYGDARIFGEKEGTWCNHSLLPEEMVFENYIDNCALIRKSAWEKVGGYDVNLPVATREDYVLWLDLLQAGFDFHYLDQFCFGYRYLENSKVRRFYKVAKNRILLQEYIFKKQLNLIQKFLEKGTFSVQVADRILARHYHQLAHSHLGFGSVFQGYRWLLSALQKGADVSEVVKSAVSWPIRRIRKS